MDPSSEKNAPGRWVSSASHPPAWSFRGKRTSGRPSWPSTSWVASMDGGGPLPGGQSYGPTHRSDHPDPCTNCIKVSRSGPRRLLPLVLRDSSPPFGHPIRVSWASLPSFAYSLVVFPTPSHLSRPLVPFLASYNQRRPRAFHSDNPASLARRPIAAPPSDRRNTESLAWPPSSNACARPPATFASIEATCNGATNIRNDRHAR
ncbi:hypothetical protein ACCO45_010310 [Purpureocillium lilacinum]|uniref:Uncharacterized protein n=1 Tax=Purpureocillium lilacinum TaxID=33203 RepID=A0ACC4DF67_PURLI